MREKSIQIVSFSIALCVGLVLLFIESRIRTGISFIIFVTSLSTVLLFAICLEMISELDIPWRERLFRWATIYALGLYLIIFSSGYGIVSLAFGFAMGVVAVISYHLNDSRWRSLIAGFMVLVVFFFGMEFFLGRYFPLEAGRWGELPALQLHPTRGFALKPNERTRLQWNRYEYVVETNSYGFNSPEIAAERPESGTLRILVVGDDFTMPNGLGYREAYPAQLEKLLIEQLKPRNVQVINAGVTAYCPVEILPLLEEVLPVLNPDIVLYQFSPSEFDEIGRNRAELLMYSGLVQSDRPLRRIILESSQMLARYKQVYNKGNTILRGKSSPGLKRSVFGRYYQENESRLYQQKNLNELRWYLAKMNVISENAGSQFVMFYAPEVVEALQLSDEAFRERQRGFSKPAQYELNLPFAHISMLTDELEIPLTDLMPHLMVHHDRPQYIRKSRHWNREGHKTVARAIFKALHDTLPELILE